MRQCVISGTTDTFPIHCSVLRRLPSGVLRNMGFRIFTIDGLILPLPPWVNCSGTCVSYFIKNKYLFLTLKIVLTIKREHRSHWIFSKMVIHISTGHLKKNLLLFIASINPKILTGHLPCSRHCFRKHRYTRKNYRNSCLCGASC